MAISIKNPTLISIVIVNYKVSDYVCQAIRSINEADLADRTEIIVVDNASKDGSKETISGEFPDVKIILLKKNIGFGKACNVGALNASGKYVLFLNPDALISRNTLSECVNFLETHGDVGILGPKILNPDGSLQKGCRRSFPTPLNSFCYLFGFSKLLPSSKRYGGYNLNFLDPDVSTEVDAISGSFMFMKRSVFNDLGGFDEIFFMYGEDLDICARIREKGYKVWYYPGTQVIHFKRKSSAKNLLRSKLAFYEAMIHFSRKYRHSYGAFFPGWLINIGIIIQAIVNIGGVIFKSYLACLIDLLFINSLLWAGIIIRFAFFPLQNPYESGLMPATIGMHILISICLLTTYFFQGVYSSERYSPSNALFSGFIASILFMAGLFFVKSMAFSRIAFASSALFIPFVLVGWREVLPRLIHRLKRLIYSTGNVIIVGNNHVASLIIKNTEDDKTAQINGIVWPQGEGMPGHFEGYPVLGSIDNIGKILEKNRADLMIIAINESWYSFVIEALASLHLRHLTIKWVKNELLQERPENLPEIIPLQNFSV